MNGLVRYFLLVLNLAALSVFCFSLAGLYAQTPIKQNLYEIPGSEGEISIAAVGDVMLGSWVVDVIEKEGISYPFRATQNYLKSADVTIANLEAPFALEGETIEKKFIFKVPPRFAEGLSDAGIKVVTLANNHSMDYGLPGLISTIETLTRVGIKFSGAGLNLLDAHQPTIVHLNGKKIAFFGYSMTFPTEFYAKADSAGTAYPDEELMQAMIRTWDDSVDFIVTSFHWSAEKRDTPKDYQIYFAHLAIDSGADLVLGHHPHVLQGLEIYKNRLIAYSLGNFAFGSYSSYAVDSIILQVYLRADGLYYARCVPINVDNREVEFQPVPVDGERHDSIISCLQRLSEPLNDGRQIVRPSGLIFGDWVHFFEENQINLGFNTFAESFETSPNATADSTESKNSQR